MLYSKDNNFLLLDNMKVGSTSLRIALIDVIPDTAFVSNGDRLGELSPRIKQRFDFFQKKNEQNKEWGKILPHDSITKAKEVFGYPEIYNSVSCVFVRNPLDQVFSHFFMCLDYEGIVNKFLNYSRENQLKVVANYFKDTHNFMGSTKGIYTEGNEIAVKHVLRYEDGLAKSLNPILKSVGLPNIRVTAKAKKFKPDNITYKDFFNDEQIDYIKQEWAWEFEEFGYS